MCGVRLRRADACPEASADAPVCADASACLVAGAPELGLTIGGMAALLDALPVASAATEFRGASPAAAAYAEAVAAVLAYEEPGGHPVPRTIALITDGHLDCGGGSEPPDNLGVADPALLEQIAAAYTDHGIATLVVGVDVAAAAALGPDAIPGFDPAPSLAALGQAGGLGYFAIDDPWLVAQFDPPDEILTCELDLTQTEDGPPTPEQIPLVTVILDSAPLPYVEPDACEAVGSGWTWLVDGEILRVCGAACEVFEAGDGFTIEIVYGCPESS